MAGYHYKLQIVPKIAASFDESNYWKSEQPDSTMLSAFRSLLPTDNTWGETEEFRSKANYSVLYIWWNSEKVWSILFEYAPTEDKPDDLLNNVLSLCQEFGYYLYSEDTKNVLSPNKRDLWQDFKQCRQFTIYKDRLSAFL
jgi:hypothetical protein